MLLVDTSVWIDHLNKGDTELAQALISGAVACHPYIIGEISLGSLKLREQILLDLRNLPASPTATLEEVNRLIEIRGLYSRGIGFVDVCLIASALLVPGMKIWTRDKRLDAVCEELAIAK